MSGEAPSMEVRYAIEIDVFHRTEHGGVGGSWRDCTGWPCRAVREACYDTEHPDGAYCANTTGLHTCYSKAEHDADNLPQASSGELEERGAHPQSRRITQSKGRQARASSGESDE